MSIVNQVSQLYIGILGRAADRAGLEYWVNQVQTSKLTIEGVAKSFQEQPEWVNGNGKLDRPGILNELYKNLFGREATGVDKAYWVLGEGASVPLEKLVLALIAPGAALGNDAIVLAQRTDAAVNFSFSDADTTDLEAAAAVITGVNGGSTFMLTAGADNVAGTAGNDTINVVYTNSLGDEVTTWQSFDVIGGGAGTDTMNIYVSGNKNSVQAGTVTGVEIVNVFNDLAGATDNFGEDAGGIDASKFQGVEQIWQIDGATNISKLAATTTAGFRGDAKVSESIAAANDAASITVALDMADVTDGEASSNAYNQVVELAVSGLTLSEVNLSGELTYEGTTPCGDLTMKDGAVELKISSSTDTVALNSVFATTVTYVSNELTTLNAAASSGDITVDDGDSDGDIGTGQLESITTGDGDDTVHISFRTTATKAAAVVTGEGDDAVVVNTDGVGETTVDTGAGADEISVNSGSETLAIVAGEGDDVLEFLAGFESAGSEDVLELTVDMGAGDDEVEFEAFSLDTLPADWVIDGGEGTDTVVIGSGNARTFSAQDYTAVTENLVGFEKIGLVGSDGESVVIDASRMTGYSTIARVDGDMTITKVTTQEIGMIGSTADVLNVTADGYSAGTTTVYGADLTVFAEDVGAGSGADAATLTAKGNSLTLTVDATEDASGSTAGNDSALTVAGDVKTMTVTLNSTVEDNDASCPDDLENTGVNEASVTVVASSTELKALTTLTLSGTGAATVTNSNGSKLATVNAVDLTNLAWDASGAETVVGEALDYTTTNAGVAEVITLGSGLDALSFDSTFSLASFSSGSDLGFVSVSSEDNETPTLTLNTDGISDDTNFTVTGLTVTYDSNGTASGGATSVSLDGFYASYADFVAALDAVSGIEADVSNGDIVLTTTDASDWDAGIAVTEFTVSSGVLFASTVAKTDTVNGLNLVEDASVSDAIDEALSDLISVSLEDSASFDDLTTAQATSVAAKSSLGLALNEVALLSDAADQYLVFTYGGNTYIYGDVNFGDDGKFVDLTQNNRVDDGDLLIKLAGVQDLDLVLASLSAV